MEFILTNYILILNIYILGMVTYLIIEMIARGFAELPIDGAIKESFFWPLKLFYAIGAGLGYLKFKKDTNAKR